jgi:RNA polymerase sigma-70 factor (ECF subfamily)
MTESIESTEEELLQRARLGDAHAFDAFVRRESPRVYGWMCRAVGREAAEDLTQEIFLKAFRGLSRYRGEATARAWLAAIAHNAVKNQYRFLGRFRRVFSAPPDRGRMAEPADPRAGPEETAGDRERRARIATALEHLPERFRMPLVLRDLDGWSYEEIASSLHLPLGTVKSRIARARGLLKAVLAPLLSKERR